MQNTISWKEDHQFGYEIAEHVPGIDDEDLLQPQRLYANKGVKLNMQPSLNKFIKTGQNISTSLTAYTIK